MTTQEQATAAERAEFERVLVASGALECDDLGVKGLEMLYSFFEAGVRYAGIGEAKKRLESPPVPYARHPNPSPAPLKEYPRAWKPKRKDGEPIKVTHPDEPATDKQYQFLKKLVAGDTAKANGIMTRKEYESIFSDIGVLNKGEASDLIDRLVKAGIKPKRK